MKKTINNSITKRDDFFECVKSLLTGRGINSYIPTSFLAISDDILAIIGSIDKDYQGGLISYDEAMRLIANLIESEIYRNMDKEREQYNEELRRLAKFHKLYLEKYTSLLARRNSNQMTWQEFIRELYLLDDLLSEIHESEKQEGLSR